MSGRNVPVVLIPRYTSYVGGGIYSTLPIPVSAYEGLVLSVWRGNMIGNPVPPPSMLISMHESNDLETWSLCGGTYPTPGADSEIQCNITFSKAWFRMSTILNTASSGGTMWAQGFFIMREK